MAGRALSLVIGFIGLSYLAQQGWRKAREYFWLDQAGQQRLLLETQSSRFKIEISEGLSNLKVLNEASATVARYVSALKKAAVIEPMNGQTTYEIGEALRLLSWEGGDDYEKLALEAIQWFQKGTRLNPFDGYNYLKIGMCLDWTGRHAEAAPNYTTALHLAPNDYYVLALQGWHYVQAGDYATAKGWLERSLEVQNRWLNPIAWNYLEIVNRKLKEFPAAPTADGRFTR